MPVTAVRSIAPQEIFKYRATALEINFDSLIREMESDRSCGYFCGSDYSHRSAGSLRHSHEENRYDRLADTDYRCHSIRRSCRGRCDRSAIAADRNSVRV